jgi:hypothetical protein
MQKPFSMQALVNIVEDEAPYQGLNQLMSCLKEIEENSLMKAGHKRVETRMYSYTVG